MIYKKTFPLFPDKSTCRFTTWAPIAEKVQLIAEGFEHPLEMKQEEFGYWTATIENTSPGIRYKYLLNGSDSFPDPASLSQPDGVHEASEAIDLSDFNWTDASWENIPMPEMIQYELHTGTFSPQGDFNGILEKIDYLKKLGVNTIELLPVAQFSGNRNWGYDGVYPFAVQNSYGKPADLMRLVDQCHANGIAVIMDVVYNHFGPEGNYTANFGHFFSESYITPWGQPVNFDGKHSDGVRNFFVQNALMWLRDYHIDGLRLDAVHAIFDFGAKHIMQELTEKTEELSRNTGRDYYLIAESHLNDVKYINPLSLGGYGLHAQWSDDFHHAVHTLVTGEKKGYYSDFGKSRQLAKAIKETFVFDGKYSDYRKKTYGNSTRKNPGHQFVIFSQNHDQVGNRMQGERLISLSDFETAKVIAGVMFLTPNVPMIFMGEEYGERNPFYYFVSHLDPELNRLVSEGRQNEFSDFYSAGAEMPDPVSIDTFNASKLSWNIEKDKKKNAMFLFYKKLIDLRKNHPVLKVPDKDNLRVSIDGNVFVIERWQEEHTLIAGVNFSNQQFKMMIPPEYKSTLRKIFDSNDEQWQGTGEISPDIIAANEEVNIQERSFLIYSASS